MVQPGVAELDLAAEIGYRLRCGGASGESFEPIVASGPRSALPHARASSRRIGKNELVVLDLGAILRRDCSDLTRTGICGSRPYPPTVDGTKPFSKHRRRRANASARAGDLQKKWTGLHGVSWTAAA